MRRRLTIHDMRNIAEEHGGECLSDEYVNSIEKLKWRCSEGHEWEGNSAGIRAGRWCWICGRKSSADKQRDTIEKMALLAHSRNGECLSGNYVNSHIKLKWRCSEGHEWEATPNSIQSGHWCPYCAGRARLTLEEMREIAMSRGGQCLSKEYVNSKSNLLWKCSDGHEWASKPGVIRNGSWCPVCSQGVSERFCRAAFEKIFNMKFPKRRPKWLMNPETGFNLELDGYCEKGNIAFEFQGRQHFQEVSFFQEKYTLHERKKLDLLKRRICKEHGVILIVVPMMPYEKMVPFIIGSCKKNGLKIEKVPIDTYDFRSYDIYSPHHLHQMKEIAKSRGGECLSKAYITNHTKMKWRCCEGHVWNATPGHIKSGEWCPNCSQNVVKTLEDMRILAQIEGGECLATEYSNAHTKLTWRCSEGHEWEAVPNSVQQGSWCPYCSGNVPLAIDEMKEIAKSRGGECLSPEYRNNRYKLRWQCSIGHEWEASPGNIKKGKWCPTCAGNKRLTIEHMEEMARKRNGHCLSTYYKNSNSKLSWQCSKGHQWNAIPNNVKRGSWCPICAGRKGQSL